MEMNRKIYLSEDKLTRLIKESVSEVMAQTQAQAPMQTQAQAQTMNAGMEMTDKEKTKGMPMKLQMQKLIQLNKTLSMALKQANELGLTDARNNIGFAIAVVEAEFTKLKIGQGVDKVKGWFGNGKQQRQ